MSIERLQRFFVSDSGGYRVAKRIRDLCVFSRQNVVRDPPFSHLDLISCRNVLIYLEPVLQRRVFPTFHYALEPHGLLVLGSAESPGATSEFFVPLDKRLRIYRRRDGLTRLHDMSGPALHLEDRRGVSLAPPLEATADQLRADADRLVLARHAPPGVVIDERFEILQFRGNTSAVLAHAPGAASLHLLKLAPAELGLPLQAAVARARAEGRPVREAAVAVIDAGRTRHVTIEVIPFQPASTRTQLFVILFEERRNPPSDLSGMQDEGTAGDERTRHAASGQRREGPVSRDEADARERYFQALVEQHESALEELRAANEEIQSSNEELQSTNEELETTKEEVQSTNEELTTVNEELRHRNRDQAVLASDLENILASTTIPIVIVGKDLRLRRFTPASHRIMRAIPSDIGRSLRDIRLRVALPDLEQRIAATVETLTVTEDEVRGEDGHWWSLTIRPFKTVDHVVDGAVLVFSDIDASKQAGERAIEAVEAQRQLLTVAEEAQATAERARAGAEMANKAKVDFLASMSHDLRTPLNAISGYAQLMEIGVHGPITDAQRTDIASIERSARHLLSLITDILNFAQVEAGRVAFQLADVPVEAVVVEIEEMIAPQLGAKLVRIEPGACDTVLHADPERVRQILVNLLSNAAKFTGPTDRLGVRCTTTTTAVALEVWDTGVGIPADQLTRIFEPFVQVGRGLTTPSPGGVGLGLTISRDLARAMGGDLTVRSAVGVGSTFTLTLPRAVR